MAERNFAGSVGAIGIQRHAQITSVAVLGVVVLALYGPKIGGVVDLSLAGSALGLLLLSRYRVGRPSGGFTTFIFLVAIAAWYTLAIVLVSGADDLVLALRVIRALLATVILGVVFFNLAAMRLISARTLINIFVAALMVNAAVVLLGIAQPVLQTHLAGLYGFNKGLRSLRSFGLTAGYDTAGYLNSIGATLAGTAAYYGNRSERTTAWYLASLVVFGAASLFTSRTAMLLTGTVVILVSLAFLRSRNRRLIMFTVGLLIVTSIVTVVYVKPMILSTIPAIESIVKSGAELDSRYYERDFARTDIDGWRRSMWFLPESTGERFFGTGTDPGSSDVGYVILVYAVGVVGLLLTIAPAAYALYMVLGMTRLNRRGLTREDDESVAAMTLAAFATFLLIILFIVNLKNLYFLTRGYHELTVITVAFLFGLEALRLQPNRPPLQPALRQSPS